MKSSCFHLPLAVSLWCATFLVPSALHADCCGGGGGFSMASPTGGGKTTISVNWSGADDTAQVVLVTKTTSDPNDAPRRVSGKVKLKSGEHLYTMDSTGAGSGETLGINLLNADGTSSYTGTAQASVDGKPNSSGETCPAPSYPPITAPPKPPETTNLNSSSPTSDLATDQEEPADPADEHGGLPGLGDPPAQDGGAPGDFGHSQIIPVGGGPRGEQPQDGLDAPSMLFKADAGTTPQKQVNFSIAGELQSPGTSGGTLGLSDFNSQGAWGGFMTSQFSGSGSAAVRKFLTPEGLTVVKSPQTDNVLIKFYKGLTTFTEPSSGSPDRTTTIEKVSAVPPGVPGDYEGTYPVTSPATVYGWKSTVASSGTPAPSVTTRWSRVLETTTASTPQPKTIASVVCEEIDANTKRLTEQITTRLATTAIRRVVTTRQWLLVGTQAQLLFRDQGTYETFTGIGELLVSRTLDSSAPSYSTVAPAATVPPQRNLTTSWEYWTSATADGPDFGKVKFENNWDGSWFASISQSFPLATPPSFPKSKLRPWKNRAAPTDRSRAALEALLATPSGGLQKEVVLSGSAGGGTLRYVAESTASGWTLVSKMENDANPSVFRTYANASCFSRTTTAQNTSSSSRSSNTTKEFVTSFGGTVFLSKSTYERRTAPVPTTYGSPVGLNAVYTEADGMRVTDSRSYDSFAGANEQHRVILDREVTFAEDGRVYQQQKMFDEGPGFAPILLETRMYTYDARKRKTSVSVNGIAIETWSYPDDFTTLYTGEDGVTHTTVIDALGRLVEERIGAFAGAPGVVDTAGVPPQPAVATVYSYSKRPAGAGVVVTSAVRALDDEDNVIHERPLSIDEYDGAGDVIRHTDSPTGRTDFYLTLAGSPGKTQEKHLATVTIVNGSPVYGVGALLESSTYFQDGRIASSVAYSSATIPSGKYYNYSVEGEFLIVDSASETAPSSPGSQLPVNLTTSTVRDGIGRVVKITRPSVTFDASTGAATAAAVTTEYEYDERGRLMSAELPETGSGQAYEKAEYSYVPGSQTSVLFTYRDGPAGSPPPKSNQSRRSSSLQVISGVVWEEEVSESPDRLGTWRTTSISRNALGPFPAPAPGEPVKVSWSVASSGGAEVSVEKFIDPATSVTEVRKTRNGILIEDTVSYNGLPCVFKSPLMPYGKILTYTELREPAAEPSFATVYWPGLVYLPGGQLWKRLQPVSGAVQEMYAYYGGYTSNDARVGLLSSKTAPASGGTTYYDYDWQGRLLKQWGSGDYPVLYAYDAFGRLQTMTTYRSGTSWSLAAWPASPPAGDVTTWAYASPALSWLIKKTDAAGASVDYTYHPGGALATRRWARNQAGTSTRLKTTYGYDGFGRLNSIDYGDSTPDVTYLYDAGGRVMQRTDGTGNHVFDWRPDGQLELEQVDDGLAEGLVVDPHYGAYGQRDAFSINWGAAAAAPLAYTYENLLLTGVSAGLPASRDVVVGYSLGTTTPSSFDYRVGGGTVLSRSAAGDGMGNVNSISYTAPKPPGQTGSIILASLTYGYNVDMVSTVARENNNQWVYEYDTRSQVSKARKRYTAGSDAQILAGTQASYSYDPIGNRTLWNWGGSSTKDAGLRTTLYQTTNNKNQYTDIRTDQYFDVTGMRTSGTNPVTLYKNYDAPLTLPTTAFQSGASGLYYRSDVAHPNPSTSRYDAITVSTAGIVSDSGLQYVPPAIATPAYDLDGNLVTDGRWTYTWDAENRLTVMECPGQPANIASGIVEAPAMRLTFFYDGLSRRVAKKVETKVYGSYPVWDVVDFLGFAYDGWNMVMSVRLAASSSYTSSTVLGRVASYVWGPDIGSSGYCYSNWQRAGGVGGLLMVLDGVATQTFASSSGDPVDDDYFPLFDRLGNIIGYRKAAVSTATVDYNNLGATGALYDYDAFGRELRSSGPAADLVPFHFSTKFTDQETGLNYYGYRYYDPQNGRWLGRDPVRERGGINLFSILKNCSVCAVDINGLAPYEKYETFAQANAAMEKDLREAGNASWARGKRQFEAKFGWLPGHGSGEDFVVRKGRGGEGANSKLIVGKEYASLLYFCESCHEKNYGYTEIRPGEPPSFDETEEMIYPGSVNDATLSFLKRKIPSSCRLMLISHSHSVEIMTALPKNDEEGNERYVWKPHAYENELSDDDKLTARSPYWNVPITAVGLWDTPTTKPYLPLGTHLNW